MFFALPQPTREDFESNGLEFGKRWNFPNVLGCIDGKHIKVRCPDNTGSLYFNYKDFFSMVLLAIVGPTYKFVAVDVGSFGREGDAGIFSKCALGRAIKEKQFDFPAPKVLPNSDIIAPYVFLGDAAFPLLDNLLKPYPRNQSQNDRSKIIFNYRLSRARRIVENAFGILSQHFRIFFTPIQTSVDVIEDLVTVVCIIHNLMIDENRDENDQAMLPLDSIEDYHEFETENNQELRHSIQDSYKEYFNGSGSVSWQNDSFRL